jgi:hypothetical protein
MSSTWSRGRILRNENGWPLLVIRVRDGKRFVKQYFPASPRILEPHRLHLGSEGIRCLQTRYHWLPAESRFLHRSLCLRFPISPKSSMYQGQVWPQSKTNGHLGLLVCFLGLLNSPVASAPIVRLLRCLTRAISLGPAKVLYIQRSRVTRLNRPGPKEELLPMNTHTKQTSGADSHSSHLSQVIASDTNLGLLLDGFGS